MGILSINQLYPFSEYSMILIAHICSTLKIMHNTDYCCFTGNTINENSKLILKWKFKDKK